jgi:hypothetical protein
MVYPGPDQGLFCRTCGARVRSGWACGGKGGTVFWYCPTCDEFLEWNGAGLTEGMSEECQTSMRSFLRYIINRAQSASPNKGGRPS